MADFGYMYVSLIWSALRWLYWRSSEWRPLLRRVARQYGKARHERFVEELIALDDLIVGLVYAMTATLKSVTTMHST